MQVDLQMSVLLQTWRVIEILSSPGFKDPQIGCECRDGKSSFGEMSFSFERELGNRKRDLNPLEFDVSDFGGVVDDCAWEWDRNNTLMKSISAQFRGPNPLWKFPVDFRIDAIRHGSDGFQNALSLTDANLKIPIALLFRN